MTPTIRLLLVDDHTLFRRGLKALLEQDERFTVSAEAGDVGEALRCLQRERPDVILLDNHLPGVRGVDAIPALKEAAPAARVLMLTVSENENDLAAALQAGADGYLLKTVESDQLCETIGGNVDFACSYITRNFEGVEVSKPEGTYMLFLDCSGWCERQGKTLDQLLKAGWDVGVGWQDGRPFQGPSHIRLNLALPRTRVEEAMERLNRHVFHR